MSLKKPPSIDLIDNTSYSILSLILNSDKYSTVRSELKFLAKKNIVIKEVLPFILPYLPKNPKNYRDFDVNILILINDAIGKYCLQKGISAIRWRKEIAYGHIFYYPTIGSRLIPLPDDYPVMFEHSKRILNEFILMCESNSLVVNLQKLTDTILAINAEELFLSSVEDGLATPSLKFYQLSKFKDKNWYTNEKILSAYLKNKRQKIE